MELELLQLIDESTPREGSIVLIFESFNGTRYYHYKEAEMPYVTPKLIEKVNGRLMVKKEHLWPYIEKKYEVVFDLPHNGRD